MGDVVGRSAFAAVLTAIIFVACGDGVEKAAVSGDSATDTDTDTDVDSDTDADTDTGTDTCPGCDYQVSDISACGNTTCAVLEGGHVKCWGSSGSDGYSTSSALGYPDNACSGPSPADCPFVEVGALVSSISTSGSHTCALLEDGGVKCWGWNTGVMYDCSDILGYGEGYDCGDCQVPTDWGTLDLGGPAEQISTYGTHSSAVISDGTVVTWGCSYQPPYGGEFPDDYQLSFAGDAAQVSSGSAHHCALLENGDVYCWGYNDVGQLGYGNTDFVAAGQVPNHSDPVELGGPAVQVAAGGDHSCAILEVGDVVCWGWGQWGQLGYGDTEDVGDDELPVDVGTIDLGGQAVGIAAGKQHTCAILEGGTLKCWGAGGSGNLGYCSNEDIGDDEVPADMGSVLVGGSVVQVSAGGSHTCAVLETGAIRCWGANQYSQLGYGNDLETEIGDDEVPASLCEVPVM